MELIFYSVIILITLIAIFFLVEQPYKIAPIIVFMMLYQFNIETPLPLDARGLLILLLFARLYFFDKENMRLTNSNLFGNKFLWLILVFTLLILAEPIISSKNVIRYIKDIVMPLVCLTIGFILVKNEEGRKGIVYGIILAGILSTIELVFTFFTAGSESIDTIKLLDLLLGKVTFNNHNYPGFLSGMGLLFIYLAWYRTKLNKYLLLILGFSLFLGVLISTSRSALLAVLIIFTMMTFIEPALRHNLKKIMTIGVVFIILLIGFFVIYNVFYSGKARSHYVDIIYYRLYEEPLQILGGEKSEFNPWTGQRTKGSMIFRENRWKDDLSKFTNLSLTEQYFGLGPKGFLRIAKNIYAADDNVYERLAPHNGYLLILLERGILGLLLFVIIIISISISAIKVSKAYNLSFPFIYLFLIIVIYSFAQNAELTSAYAYLTFGCIIGNIVYSKMQIPEEEEFKLLNVSTNPRI